MAKLASGKKSVAISDRSGFKIKYTDLKTTWDGLRVEPSEWEPKHPQLTPAKNVVDATALFQPRPDNDPENVDIFLGYSQDIFASRVQRSQTGVGINGQGSVGFVGISLSEPVTGLAGTTAIGTFAPGFEIDGVSATGAIGTAIAEDQVDVTTTGTEGTGAVSDVSLGATATSTSATGAIGTSTLNYDYIFDQNGVSGTGVANEGAGGITFTAQNGAQLSTAQQKFGTASLFLDGVNDSVVSDETYNFGSNVFTVDMWVRPTSGTQDNIFYDSRDSTSNNAIALRQAGDNLLVLRANGTLFNINNVFSTNTWVHVAIARGDPFGNTFSVYVNGTNEGSTTFGLTATAADIHIGSDFNGANNWAGYIDELRISDIDRYSGTSFVAPSAPYNYDENTVVLLHFDGVDGSTSIVNTTETSVFETDSFPSGVAGTGAIGDETPTTDAIATGVSGTSAIGTFGEEGDGTLNLSVQGVGVLGDIGTGTEEAESQVIEANDTGWGEQYWGYGQFGGDPEIVGTGNTGTPTIDIFNGPNPVTGSDGSSAIGTFVTESEITETGVAGTGNTGTVSLDTDVEITGTSGTGAIGTSTPAINPGFGEGAWNDGTWGN